MAQVLLQHRLDASRIEAHVHSAGEMRGGVSASPGSVHAMAARGLDLSQHRSRALSAELLREADLVVTMARRHVREAVLACPEAWPRTFTLKELVRRGGEVGPRRKDQSLAAWLAEVGAGRRPSDLVGEATTDDVADPIGSPDHAYERTAAELSELIDRLVDLAFPNANANAKRSADAGPGAPAGASASPTVTQEG